MIRTIVIFIFYTAGLHTYGQTTGFYLTRACETNEQKKIVTITDQRVCITDEPIIIYSEIESIGELKARNNRFHFDIILSDNVIKKVNVLTASLTEPSVVLVIDDNLFAILPLAKLEKKKVYRLSGSMHYYPTVEALYKKLDAIVRGQ